MNDKKIGIGILGFGTVGSGTAKILLEQADSLKKRTGMDITLQKICDRDVTTDRGFPVPDGVLTTDINELFSNPDVHVFVELIGGIEPAKTFILKAIEHGKHVATANKALLALHGKEIMEAAAQKGVCVGFEASVGGGVPVIKAVREGLRANRFQAVMGIMNGTANYILSRMSDEGLVFEDVLKEAQRLGFAEADPTYDVEGIDTAHKLTILARLAFEMQVELSDIHIEGISSIKPIDIEFAKELGYEIKLLAIAQKTGEELELRVHPTMIPATHLLAQVKGAYNAFYLIGDAVGKVMLYGLGAGQMPTGSAVVADICDIALAQGANVSSGMSWLAPLSKHAIENLSSRYYFRFSAKDQPGVLAGIAGVLGQHNISIESCVQKARGKKNDVPIVMLTHEAMEKDVQNALAKLDQLDIVTAKTTVIRIEEGENI